MASSQADKNEKNTKTGVPDDVGEIKHKVSVLIVTHKTTRDAIDAAVAAFDATGVVAGETVALRIEEV